MARPGYFSWDLTRTSGMDYNANKIKASEWNRLLTNINDLRTYCSLSTYTYPHTPIAGDTFLATDWNTAIDAIDEMSAYYTDPLPSTRSSGDSLMASYFEAIKDCVNSIELPAIDYAWFVFKTDNTSTGSSTNKQVKLPLESTGSYNFVVDWGDSSSNTITTWNQAEVTHTYSSIGTYDVKITGLCKGWRFSYTGDKLKLLDIKNLGSNFVFSNTTTFDNILMGCTNLDITTTEVFNLTNATSIYLIFYQCYSLVFNSSIGSWDLSTVINASGVFASCTNFNQDLSGWNTSSVVDMSAMFTGCSIFDQDLSGWNTSSVIDMSDMFYGCSIFDQDLSGWNTSLVVYMHNMFNGCSSFDQDLSGWNTSSTTWMSRMFYGCTNFDQDISGWNTSSVVYMHYMFQYCTSFDQDLSSWNISSVTDMTGMFDGCTLSTANYDSLLIGWAAQSVQHYVPFSGGNSKYSAAPSAAATARDQLVYAYGWSITDGGSI